jgi:hypothetical protein
LLRLTVHGDVIVPCTRLPPLYNYKHYEISKTYTERTHYWQRTYAINWHFEKYLPYLYTYLYSAITNQTHSCIDHWSQGYCGHLDWIACSTTRFHGSWKDSNVPICHHCSHCLLCSIKCLVSECLSLYFCWSLTISRL